MSTWRILCGDVRERLADLPAGSVRCCVTSPPYWGLRDYGHAGQMGLETTPAGYVAALIGVFSEVRRVLAKDGTLWVVIGDSFQNAKGQAGGFDPKQPARRHGLRPQDVSIPGLKPKNLVGIPWRLAFALQDDGWYLRCDVIWHKPNPMPSSAEDRPTIAHEYVFLLSKSRRYFYDSDAIAEPCGEAFATDKRHVTGSTTKNKKDGYEGAKAQNPKGPHGVFGKWSKENKQASGRRMTENVAKARAAGGEHESPFGMTRNKRSVWTVTTKSYDGAHFATYPEDLIEPCILAGSAVGDTILDPFTGSGTTGAVAIRHQRSFVGVELNPAYVQLARTRIGAVAPLLAQEIA